MGVAGDLNLSPYLRALEGSGPDGWYPRPTSSAIIVVGEGCDLGVRCVYFSAFECIVFIAGLASYVRLN
jgi:hypothetical protein